MGLLDLNMELIDGMSEADCKEQLKQAYTSAMLNKFKEEEEKKAEEAKRAEATAELDTYFATKWH